MTMNPLITTTYITLKNDERPKLVFNLAEGFAQQMEITLHFIVILPIPNQLQARIVRTDLGQDQPMGTFPIHKGPFADIGILDAGGTEILTSINLTNIKPSTHFKYRVDILDNEQVLTSNETAIFFTDGSNDEK